MLLTNDGAKPTITGSIFDSRRSIMIVVASFVLIMMDGYDMFVVAFLAPLISVDLGLSPVNMGQVFAAGLAGSMIGGLVLGPVADRFGRKPTLIVSLVIAAPTTLLCAFAPSFALFAVLRFVAGFGLGGLLATIVPMLAEHFPADRRDAAVTASFIAYPFGGVIGGLVTAAFLGYGWRNIFIWTGIITSLLVIVALRMPEPDKEKIPSATRDTRASMLSTVAELFAEGRALATISIALGIFCMLLVAYLLNSWTPMIAVKAGFSPQIAALCGVSLAAGGIIAALLSTLLMRKVGLFKLAAAMVGCGALTIAAIGLAYGSAITLLGWLFIVGAFTVGGQQSTPAMAMQLYPQRMRAAGFGWQLAAGRLGSILGPIIGGYLVAANISFQSLFVLVAIPALIAAIAYALAGILRPRQDKVRP